MEHEAEGAVGHNGTKSKALSRSHDLGRQDLGGGNGVAC